MKRKRCPKCNNLKPEDEVCERVNPYVMEIYDEEIIEEMCDQCEHELRMSI